MRQKKTASSVAADPVTFLGLLAKAHASAPDSETLASGLVCVMLDRWRDLRGRFGYAGLYALRDQVQALLLADAEQTLQVFPLNEASLLLLLPPGEAIHERAKRLFALIGAHEFAMDTESVAITVSMSSCALTEAFADADSALVRLVSQTESLRNSGGNEFCSLEQTVDDQPSIEQQQKMLSLLMQALRDDTLRVVFQPLLPTSGEEVRSFQMLPRLRGSDGQLIPAADFLPAARSAGLVATLDRWMLSTATQMLERRYRDQQIRLFLSQSEALLADAARRKRLVEQLASADHVSGRLVLDFQLADAMSHLKGAETLIDMLHAAGIEICFSMVDDRSNWELLSGRLACDYVRMSPAFVQRLASSPTLESDLERLGEPARGKGIKIILPMIEDADAAATLWRKGVDFLQGNLIQAAEETIQLS
jgi:EAL domain-containing protein (putative c-di-GMP-specific phosphodiesterase class I)